MRKTEIQKDFETVEKEQEIEHIYCDDCRAYIDDEGDVYYEVREVCLDCRTENEAGVWFSFSKLDKAKEQLRELDENKQEDHDYSLAFSTFIAICCGLLAPVTVLLGISGYRAYGPKPEHIGYIWGMLGGIIWTLFFASVFLF